MSDEPWTNASPSFIKYALDGELVCLHCDKPLRQGSEGERHKFQHLNGNRKCTLQKAVTQ